MKNLQEENARLKRALSVSHGHEGTPISYQVDVLEDRFLPDHAAVTFRLPGGKLTCHIFDGNLEISPGADRAVVTHTIDGRVIIAVTPRERSKK